MEGLDLKYGETGVPIVLDGCIAFLECRVVQTVDVGTHLMFIGELLQSEILDDAGEPLTYQYYRKTRRGVAPKNAPTYIDKSKLMPVVREAAAKKFRCSACGYIYDETVEIVKFKDLPGKWICPVCGSEKEDFIEILN